MTITNTQKVARIAAVIAGMALVLTSFAPVVGAQTTTSTSTTTTTSVTTPFVRDLTIGARGTDVTALQAWLIARGFLIPAGPTGYFGTQTRSAVASFQAANGIAPVAGYFGPLTRAKVNVMLGSNPVPPPSNDDDDDDNDNDGVLRGGEADVADYDLRREDSTGSEGEEEVEVATATFDVEDGDVRIERVELIVTATNSGASNQPWRYFDRVVVMSDGDEVADMDVDSRSDWREVSRGVYRLTLTGLDEIVREGDTAELTFAFDINENIDSDDLDQEFTFHIADRGIRTTDSEGIQHYIGNDDDTVTFGFGAERTGDLSIQNSDDNPRASVLIADEDNESDEYSVFAFDIENDEDADSMITDLTIGVNGLTGGLDADDVIRRATLVVDGDEFDGDVTATGIEFEDIDVEIGGDDTVSFELRITLVRNAPETNISFEIEGSNIEAEGVRSGSDASVSGSQESEEHTIALTGIAVTDGNTDSVAINNSTTGSDRGDYTITFDVEALEETIYIGRTAGSATSTSGVVYNIRLGNDVVELTSGEVSSLLRAGGSQSGDTSEYFIVREGRTRTFTLRVTIDPDVSGFYSVELEAVRFDDERDGLGDDTNYTVPNEREFETDAEYLRA